MQAVLQQIHIHSLSITFTVLWFVTPFIGSRLEPVFAHDLVRAFGFMSLGAAFGVWKYEKLRYEVGDQLDKLQEAVTLIKADRVLLVPETDEPPNPALN